MGARPCITPTLHPAASYRFPSASVLVLWWVFCKAPWQRALLLGQDGCRDAGGLRRPSRACRRSARLAVKQAQALPRWQIGCQVIAWFRNQDR